MSAVEMALSWHIERHAEVDSTNTLANERVRDAFARGDERVHGTVIVAARQSAGRGQHGRTWESPLGGLYLSAIVEDVAETTRFALPLFAGVAVSNAIHEVSAHDTLLRWPNDVIMDGKKVAGVLCESVAQGDRWAGIIGIGVNVHLPIETLPPQIQRTATSLHIHPASSHASTPELMTRLLESIIRHLLLLLKVAQTRGTALLLEFVRRRDYLSGKVIDFQVDDRLIAGIARGIGETGELLIEVDNRLEAFSRGTILSVDGVSLRLPTT